MKYFFHIFNFRNKIKFRNRIQENEKMQKKDHPTNYKIEKI